MNDICNVVFLLFCNVTKQMATLVWELCTGSHLEEIVLHYDNVYKNGNGPK